MRTFTLLNQFNITFQLCNPFKAIDWYIIREVLRPFAVTCFFFMAIFISTILREFLGDLIVKDISFFHILNFMGNALLERLPNTIPIISLFSALLASNRLSSDLELVAMRSVGISYLRIYCCFLVTGFFIVLIMAFLNFYVKPKKAYERRILSEWLHTYYSISFVSPGRFLNRWPKMGDQIDVYANSKEASILKKLYIHFWNIDSSLPSTVIQGNKSKYSVGFSRTQKIIFSKEGELIEVEKNRKIPLDLSAREGMPRELPKGLANRDLFDLTFVNVLKPLDHSANRKRYLRLKNGFLLNFSKKRDQVEIVDFSNGWIDYSIAKSDRHYGYFAFALEVFTLKDLFSIKDKIVTGGLIFDPTSISTGKEGSIENFVEIPRKDLVPILKNEGEDLAKKSPEEIFEKYNFYIPAHMDTFQKRKTLFKDLIYFSEIVLKHRKEIIYLIHKNIAEVFSIFLFFLIAFPLGISSKRSGKGASFGLAFLVYGIYIAFANYLRVAFKKGALDPILSAWLAEVLILVSTLCIIFFSQEGRQMWHSFFLKRKL